ncbi:ABC transporter permease subunit [Nonomuraea sp. NPDC049419]|uniref:ABC transporter permease subunit n=1 Tax=Nonomuraea sp. NPDC049419 TaxID=3155772 RepID=UPI00343F5020
MRSVRSTYLTVGLALSTILLGLALAVTAAGTYDAASPGRQAIARIAYLEEVFVIVPQLAMGVLGVLAMTSEYTTGLIRTSFAIVPRRRPLLAAKAATVTVLSLVIGAVAVFGTYAAVRSAIGDRFAGAYATAIGDRLPLLIALTLTVPVFALLGLGLGALLRSPAAAIAVVAGLVYVLPIIIGNLPEPWSETLGSLMIGALPRQLIGDTNASSVYGSLLSPLGAAAVMIGYAAVPLLAATVLIRRRDV